MTPRLQDDLLAPTVVADPYPYFRELQVHDPVHWNEKWDGWIVTRYADVTRAFREPRLSSDRISAHRRSRAKGDEPAANSTLDLLLTWMVFRDPPDHTRLRLLVNKAFTPRVIAGISARIQAIVDELLDTVQPRGELDVIRDFAYPLPATVIAELLGAPPEDRDRFKEWSDDLATIVLGAIGTADRHERAQRGLLEMAGFFGEILEERRREPREDLISALIAAEDRGDLLSADEVVGTRILLLFAGHETTTNFIGNAVLALLRNPDQLERLRNESGLGVTAVEELLRFDSPIKSMVRWAVGDLELSGRRIEAGQRVLLVQAAANRDPEQFPDPDRLDLGRRENPHVAFGLGIHYCLGAALARLESRIALATLARRLPKLELVATELRWHQTILVRGVESLPVQF